MRGKGGNPPTPKIEEGERRKGEEVEEKKRRQWDPRHGAPLGCYGATGGPRVPSQPSHGGRPGQRRSRRSPVPWAAAGGPWVPSQPSFGGHPGNLKGTRVSLGSSIRRRSRCLREDERDLWRAWAANLMARAPRTYSGSGGERKEATRPPPRGPVGLSRCQRESLGLLPSPLSVASRAIPAGLPRQGWTRRLNVDGSPCPGLPPGYYATTGG